jgi:hypothetical protein
VLHKKKEIKSLHLINSFLLFRKDLIIFDQLFFTEGELKKNTAHLKPREAWDELATAYQLISRALRLVSFQ